MPPGDRPCIEMGSRRTHEQAAVAAALGRRTSRASRRPRTSRRAAGYGIPTAGTSAHSFTLLHDSERDAFTAQVRSLGRGTSLLVDTYDIDEAVALAVEIAGPELGAVRIDSGDLGLTSPTRCGSSSTGSGPTGTRIIVTSDLDEYAIAALAAAPVDGYGVGTSLVTGSGHPTCGFVYKLVSREGDDGAMVDVAKKSKDKMSIGGRKFALRRRNRRGVAEAEVVGIGHRAGATTVTTGCCWSRWCATARWSDARADLGVAAAPPRRARGAADAGADDVPGRARSSRPSTLTDPGRRVDGG